MLREIASPRAWQEFEATRDLDFAYGIEGMARFRANYFVQNQGAAAVFRIIPEEIISVEKLGLSEAIAGLADLNQGLVLVTGPTGSGKSTTLAAIVDKLNRTYARHVVDHRGPRGICAPESKIDVLPPRGWAAYPGLRPGAALGNPPGCGRDSGGRNARTGNDFPGHDGGGNGHAGLRDPAYQQCGQDHRPDHRRLSSG